MIEPRLKKLEAMAGTKNRPLVLSMPMTTAEREMKTRKGSMILVSLYGQFGLSRDQAEIRGEKRDDRPGQKDAEQGEQAEGNSKKGQDIGGQPPGVRLPSGGVVVGKDGDKGGGQGAFAEEISQQVRDAEGDDKGIIGKTGAEHAGKDLFPDQAENTAAHYRSPDGSRRSGDAVTGFRCVVQ